MKKRARRPGPSARRIEIRFSVPEDLARSYVTFMGLAHTMGNVNADLSPRDRLDMVLCGVLLEALGIKGKASAPSKGKAT